MGEYGKFAEVYDRLMSDVDYKKRAAYLLKLFKKFDRMPSLLLDVACGTGGFSIEFAKQDAEVIGIDMSEDMLCVARENSYEAGTDVLFLCQKAEELDLYGTVDGAICCLDSLNHITDYNTLCRALERIALFLEEDRLFIFDVNTEYKHENILGNNTFVIEQDGIYCVWQNEYNENNKTTDIVLDFFNEQNDGSYVRSNSSFSERAYNDNELKEALGNAGLEILAIYGDMTQHSPDTNAERVIYITKKKSVI